MMLRCIIGPATSWRLAKGYCAMDHMLKISFHGCWCPHRTEAKRIAAQLKIIRWLYGTKDYDPRCDGICRLLLCNCGYTDRNHFFQKKKTDMRQEHHL